MKIDTTILKTDTVKAAFFGAAIGDALGVPVEFMSRGRLAQSPVHDMQGYGTHDQPPGTFSDDASLLFCTAESLCTGFDPDDMARRFIRWQTEGYWGAHHAVFDIGGATRESINRLKTGVSPTLSGGMMESDNGNGSLMRILPVAFYLVSEPSVDARYQAVKQVSAITHAHFRSVLACFCYVEMAIGLLTGATKEAACGQMQQTVHDYADIRQFNPAEIALFHHILNINIADSPERDIRGSGYVLHTLEAALWCLLTTDSYESCVLRAVNLGQDTDTTGCVAGGLAGLVYGFDAIPARWVEGLVRSADVGDLAERFFHAVPR
jgi:ADP-ribosyl-[dinitrogen reductase] hydrolase